MDNVIECSKLDYNWSRSDWIIIGIDTTFLQNEFMFILWYLVVKGRTDFWSWGYWNLQLTEISCVVLNLPEPLCYVAHKTRILAVHYSAFELVFWESTWNQLLNLSFRLLAWFLAAIMPSNPIRFLDPIMPSNPILIALRWYPNFKSVGLPMDVLTQL